MFARASRLHSTKEIMLCLRQGRRRVFDLVQCSFLKKPDNLGRVTVIVDTKVSKKAVERNLLKRRVRGILAAEGLPSGDLVVRLRPGTKDIEFHELERMVQQCLRPLLKN